MLVTRIPDHAGEAEARLMEQYRGQDRMLSVLAMVTGGHQNVEDATFELPEGRALTTAVGAQLDRLGELLGFKRSGLTDEQYRAVLQGVVAESFSDGTYATAATILQSLYGASAVFVATYPDATMAFGIGSPAVDPSLYPLLQSVFFKALAGGIGVCSLVTFNAAGAFSMAGPQTWVLGFGDANDPTVGGGFGDAIYQNT
jgi:hypothetical protein